MVSQERSDHFQSIADLLILNSEKTVKLLKMSLIKELLTLNRFRTSCLTSQQLNG